MKKSIKSIVIILLFIICWNIEARDLKYCPKCGIIYEDSSYKFCKKCGQKVVPVQVVPYKLKNDIIKEKAEQKKKADKTKKNITHQIQKLKKIDVKKEISININKYTLKELRKYVDNFKDDLHFQIKIYNRILILDPKDISAYKALGDIYLKLKLFDRSIECYEKGLQILEKD